LKTAYKWIYPKNNIDEKQALEIKKTAGSEILMKLLINRGITSAEQAQNFLDVENTKITSPYVFPDMEKAVKKINEAIEYQDHIVVFGDFDADGITSTSLLYKTLNLLGANASFYLPERSEEGHGLSRAAICKLISSRKAKIIITVDCGISNVGEIKLAGSLGTDVIITDHHEPQEEIPPAYAIINPKMPCIMEDPDKKISNLKYLAGVGVAYKLALALLESNNKQHFHDEIFYFVALGTVGDVVPLLGENRIFVRQGMNLISQKRPAAIGKILEIGGYKVNKKMSAGTIAFGIIPKINAIGRLMDATPAIEFLLTEDEEKLKNFANELNENNKKRQQMCEETYNQAELKIEQEVDLEKDKAIILADKDWHPGIIGIVASKLVEKYYRPVFMVSISEEKNEARGSARSVESLNLFETLSEFADLFIQFGGHAFAAGFSFDLNKSSFGRFREKLLFAVNKTLKEEALHPELKIDTEVESSDITESFIHELEKMEPFGESNPQPIFSISNLTLLQTKKMGAKNNHLKLFLCDDDGRKFEAVWWNADPSYVEDLDRVNIAFVPTINVFNDNTAVQLILKDLKASCESLTAYEEQARSMPEEPQQTPPSVIPHQVRDFPKEEISQESNIGKMPSQSCHAFCKNSAIWHDKRNSTGLKKDFIDQIKENINETIIFAEQQKTVEIFEKLPELKQIISGRNGVKKADCFVFMDMPPDEKTFCEVIAKSQAKEIYFFGLSSEANPVDIMKKLTSMLKYAFNNKGGIIDIEQVASLLAVSSESVLACVELLDCAEVIEVLEINEETIKFNFAGSVELSLITELPEYLSYSDTLDDSENFKQELRAADIEMLKKNFTQICYETV